MMAIPGSLTLSPIKQLDLDSSGRSTQSFALRWTSFLLFNLCVCVSRWVLIPTRLLCLGLSGLVGVTYGDSWKWSLHIILSRSSISLLLLCVLFCPPFDRIILLFDNPNYYVKLVLTMGIVGVFTLQSVKEYAAVHQVQIFPKSVLKFNTNFTLLFLLIQFLLCDTLTSNHTCLSHAFPKSVNLIFLPVYF